jgi:hypothetical protein
MNTTAHTTVNQLPMAEELAELLAISNRGRLQDRERRERTIAQAVRQAGKIRRTTA